jgi:alpha-N-arabinofuranosidase
VIYDGMWDRERNIARPGVKAAIAALGTTAIRFPGSSSSSMYHWRDGIGPQDKRPFYETTYWSSLGGTILDISGFTGEERARRLRQIDPSQPNQVGTNEFLQYCVDLGIDPLLMVNVGGGNPRGEGTPEEAAAWVRYCNVDRKSPRSVQWWQFGNEIFGAHEPGHAPPRDYANRVVELASAMRRVDPSIKTVAVAVKVPTTVSPKLESKVAMPDIKSWNLEVFSIAGGVVNAASITWYFPGALSRSLRDTAGDALQMTTGSDTLAADMDRVIGDLDAVGGPAAQLPLFLGEWGRQVTIYDIISDNHKLYDGVFFAGCFNSMIQRAKRVRGAFLSMLVNTISPIQTVGDRFFVTTSYLVSQLYRWSCRTEQASVSVKTDTMLVPALEDVEKAVFVSDLARTDRKAAILDAAATVDRSGTTLYLTNRSITESITVDLTGLKPADTTATFRYVAGNSPYACNTLDAPNTVRIAEMPVVIKGGRAEVTIPPCTAGAVIAGSLTGALAAT